MKGAQQKQYISSLLCQVLRADAWLVAVLWWKLQVLHLKFISAMGQEQAARKALLLTSLAPNMP